MLKKSENFYEINYRTQIKLILAYQKTNFFFSIKKFIQN